jgi:isocitrate dehydrogenase kinase/phosphatase
MKVQMIISGVGGQGVLLITRIIAEVALQAVEEKDLKPSDPESWARFKENLLELLKVEGSLAVASKAMNVVTEQERIFSHARILSDIRSIFKDDPEANPSAVAIIHTLRIHYHQSGDLKSFFVAMDDQDLRKLKDAIDRAQKKSATLRSVAKSADIPVIKIEGESET